MDAVFEYIEKNKQMYIEMLQQLCRQPSVSAQQRGIQETADLVQSLLEEYTGATTEQLRTSGNPVVFGELNGSGSKTLSFYNHYDVQPEDPVELWESDPFGAEIRDGKLYSRGVADNKGNLAARISAVHAYRQVYGELPLNLKYIVDGEEEIGSVHSHEIATEFPDKLQSDGCIWESGYINRMDQIEVRLGLKGMLYVELHAQGANTDLHSLNAAIVVNPAWRLVWALSTLKNEQETIQIDGFYNRVRALSNGDEELLGRMDFPEEQLLQQWGLTQFLCQLKGMPLKEKLIFQPTCTICGIVSGYTGEKSKTVLPSKAVAKLDFRLVPDQDPEEILQLLRKHLDSHGFSDIQIVKISGKRAAKTDPDDALAKVVMESAEEIYGKAPQVLVMSPGTGPMYNLCQSLGIPAVGFGVGYYDSRIHAPNENIRIDDYIAGIKMVAAVIRNFAAS